MRAWILRALLLGGIITTASGCATSQEWVTWRDHPAHFASFEHMFFSFRNDEGSAPRVTRSDVQAARTEGWWGKVITVSPEQIIEQ